jgi:NAD(P)H-hydrate epimerase
MRFFSPMSVNPHPGGFAQRRISELPSVTAPQMREIQRVAQEDFGVDILQIIENAGRAGARLALGMLGGKGRGQRIVVLAGGGNKGAAGLCMARTLVNWGFVVDPVLAEVQGEMAYVARRQVQILKAAGIVDKDNEEPSEFLVEEQLANADLVIDALIGYGLEGPPTGMAAAVTDLALQSGRPILAMDVPTGVNASTGLAAGMAIKAVTTLMIDLPKRGLLEPHAKPYTGELYLADLGIPKSVHEGLGIRHPLLFSEGPIVRIRR